MKISVIASLTFLILTFSACKKPDYVNELPAERTNCQIIEHSFSNNGQVGKILYTYDDQKRVTNVRYDDGSETANYVYAANQIEETVTDIQGTTQVIYTLDATGKVISAKQTSISGTKPNTESTFNYDPAGYLLEIVTKNLTTNTISTEKYAYSLGNLTEFDNGTQVSNIIYETNIPYQESYYMPLMNLSFPKYYFHVLKSYMGKRSNLIATGVIKGNIVSNFNFLIDENLNIAGINFGSIINYTINSRYSCPVK